MAEVNTAIRLPVEAEITNLGDVIKQFKGLSKHLRIDSPDAHVLLKSLSEMERALDSIKKRSESTFDNPSEFKGFAKSLDKLKSDISKFGDAFNNLGTGAFDLGELAMQAQQEFEAVRKTVNAERQKLASDFKANIIGDAKFNIFGFSSSDIDKSEQEISSVMQKKFDQLLKKKEEAEKKLLQAQNNIKGNTAGARAMSLLGLNETLGIRGLQDELQKVLNANKQVTNKQPIIDFLTQQFSLTNEDVQKLQAALTTNVTKTLNLWAGNGGSAEFLKALGIEGDTKNVLKRTKGAYLGRITTAQNSVNTTSAQLQEADQLIQQYNIKREQLVQAQAALQQQLATATNKKNETVQQPIISIKNEVIENVDKGTQAISNMGTITDQTAESFERLNEAQNKLSGIQNIINRYLGAVAIFRTTINQIKKAVKNISQIDKAITGISIVTNMSTDDLWGQINTYTKLAEQYGTTVEEVYKVSQIFYQQGLQTTDVMALSNEALTMMKITGMSATTAADALTTAVRSFNIEMTEAAQVTDTYSALAANFAVSSNELASAMEKTASSAASVGMTVQSTSAFMTQMIATTRESANNIGSALKSIISRLK